MEIVISPLAQWKIERLLNYLETEWSVQSKYKFWSILLKALNQISNQPKSCPESKELSGLFKKVVTKQTSFFYRIRLNKIEVVDLIDNRQNPDEVYIELKKHFG